MKVLPKQEFKFEWTRPPYNTNMEAKTITTGNQPSHTTPTETEATQPSQPAPFDPWTWSFGDDKANGEGGQDEAAREAQAQELDDLLKIVRDRAKGIAAARKASEEVKQRTGGLRAEEAQLRGELEAVKRVIAEEARGVGERVVKVAMEGGEGEGEVEEVVGEFVEVMGRLKEQVKAKQQAMDDLQSQADPKAVEMLELFREALEGLKKRAEEVGRKVPWQIEYYLLLTPKEEESKTVPFEGGKVTLPDGSVINETRCTCCGMVVQHWAFGEGHPRYHCMDGRDPDHCVTCHELLQSVAAALRSKHPKLFANVAEKLNEPYLASEWIQENNIPTFLRFPVTDSPTLATALNSALRVYGPRPCFGVRSPSDTGVVYKWLTYNDVRESTINLAIGMKEMLKLQPKDFVGICSDNRPEWLYTDFACVLNELVSVGIITSWPLEDLVFVINNADIACIVCQDKYAHKFLQIKDKCPSLKRLVIIGDYSSDFSKSGDFCISFDAVQAFGAEHAKSGSVTHSLIGMDTPMSPLIDAEPTSTSSSDSASSSFAFKPRDPEDMVSLIYSSGSTGMPKGIIETERRWKAQIDRAIWIAPLVVLSYAPLAHGMDRGMVWTTVANGGRVGFCTGDEAFLEEIATIEPTVFVAMPPLWNKLYSIYERELSELAPFEAEKKEEARKVLVEKMSRSLGTRLEHITTGGASISEIVLAFMKECFASKQISNNYGCTEVPGISQDGEVSSSVEMELRDVPEMGYSANDKPYPRGEIVVRSKTMTPGYWKNDGKTKESFTDDGWFLTGDIGMLDDDNKLHLIDRKKNLIELYVEGRSVWLASGLVESYYQESPWIHNLFIFGERTQADIVAVIVPKKSTVLRWLGSLPDTIPTTTQVLRSATEASYEAVVSFLEKDEKENREFLQLLREAIIEDLVRIGKKLDLKTYEIPRGLVLDMREWTVEDGRRLGIGKVARAKVLAHYRHSIDMEYERICPA